jgi:hypothetical protein
MMDVVLVADGLASPESQLGQTVVRILAVAGGALVGGLGSGLLLQLLVRLTTAGKTPKWAVQFVRVLGAIAGAWLVYLFLFGGSGGGGSGSGWWPGGSGGGLGTGKEGTEPGSTAREGPTTRETGREHVSPLSKASTLRVEVLGDSRVEKAHFYRPEGEGPLLNLEDVKKRVERRREQAPPLQKIEIVLYENSPDQDTAVVKELESWARQRGLATSIENAPGKAP